MTGMTSERPFEGFGEHALDFYLGLAADNSRTYWHAHRPRYESAVAGPLRALATELEPDYGTFKIFRPYRDVRFSPDKRPFKEAAGMVAEGIGGGALYVELGAAGLMIAGGYYVPARDQLDRWRRLQDEPTVARELDTTLDALAADGYRLGEGDPVRTAPRGWRSDHPRISMIRRRRLEAYARHPPGEWLHTRECLEVVRRGFGALQRWNEWLGRRVGPGVEGPGTSR
jgi:uncharacterized protein (TIGR02453 family)